MHISLCAIKGSLLKNFFGRGDATHYSAQFAARWIVSCSGGVGTVGPQEIHCIRQSSNPLQVWKKHVLCASFDQALFAQEMSCTDGLLCQESNTFVTVKVGLKMLLRRIIIRVCDLVWGWLKHVKSRPTLSSGVVKQLFCRSTLPIWAPWFE